MGMMTGIRFDQCYYKDLTHMSKDEIVEMCKMLQKRDETYHAEAANMVQLLDRFHQQFKETHPKLTSRPMMKPMKPFFEPVISHVPVFVANMKKTMNELEKIQKSVTEAVHKVTAAAGIKW